MLLFYSALPCSFSPFSEKRLEIYSKTVRYSGLCDASLLSAECVTVYSCADIGEASELCRMQKFNDLLQISENEFIICKQPFLPPPAFAFEQP
jgi:hypothetical protein